MEISVKDLHLPESLSRFARRMEWLNGTVHNSEGGEEIVGLNYQKFNFYDPKLVYFGVHSGKQTSQMEMKKLVYASQLHQRRTEKTRDCIDELKHKLRHRIVYFYHLDRKVDVDMVPFFPGFGVESILIDACFIIELIHKCANHTFIEHDDPIFFRGITLETTIRDLFVLKNQLPFFLLKELFNITKMEKSFEESVGDLMEQELCIGPICVRRYLKRNNPKHLLAFVRDLWVYSSELGRLKTVGVDRKTGRQQVIGNATELHRAGIRFKGVKRPTFDLKFNNGILEIPVLSITAQTGCFLQNVGAYEQNSHGDRMVVISDYCVVMDCLIQSPQDVQLLREYGVINSYLHDDKDVVELFDNVGKRTPSSALFSYSGLFDDVNKHCVGRWNSWKAKLRRNYFKDDNQLEVVSFMFAIYILLPVTILQTVFTVLSYYKD